MSGRAGQRDGTGAAETPEDIEARLLARREALSAGVDELAARLDPRARTRPTMESLRDRAAGLRGGAGERAGRARRAIEGARDGDPEAIKRVVAVAGGALAASLLPLLVRRRLRRR